MSSITKSTNQPTLVSLFHFLINRIQQRQNKVYDYTQYISGRDYVFEVNEDATKAYMTAHGKGIKVGDRILIQKGNFVYHYDVEAIDYYSNPSDMWMGCLIQVKIVE
jgi:MioC protein